MRYVAVNCTPEDSVNEILSRLKMHQAGAGSLVFSSSIILIVLFAQCWMCLTYVLYVEIVGKSTYDAKKMKSQDRKM